MNNGKVSIWISVSTLGFEVASVLAKSLMTQEDTSGYEVHMMPSMLALTEDLVQDIKQADLLVLGDKLINANSISREQYIIEKTLFPVGYSKYKRVVQFITEESRIIGVTKDMTVPNVATSTYTLNPNGQLAKMTELVLREVQDVIQNKNDDLNRVKTYNVGVAIELLKSGVCTVSKQSWSGKTLKLHTAPNGDSYIKLYCADADISMAWMPEPSDLLDEDYYTV